MNTCYQQTTCGSVPPTQTQKDPLAGLPVAMGYVPWQNLTTVYEPDKALQVGTIFPELRKPFEGRRI